jgi:tetratricopeptide (TPR) repeat protein
MPLDPQRIQSVFLSAVECHEPAARAAVLDRACSGDAELQLRVEALLLAHDQRVRLLDQQIVGPASHGTMPLTRPANIAPEGPGLELPIDASEAANPTVGVMPDADFTRDIGTSLAMSARAVPAISGYEILGELVRGGMGVVYRARQVRLNRVCALKMILGGVHASPEAATRFLAEAEAVARLQHGNIVQIHHIGEADGLPYFELEYVDGGSLDRQLDGSPWPARRAAELIESAARGVAEAHRLGIVHRDLKPGNVLLAADGTPKITDFGLAKSLAGDSGLTRTDSIMGSPGYMSPEQAEGKTKQVGPLGDVYALGVIIYELLTGGLPFRGTTALEILDQVKNAEPVPPSRLVPGLPRDVETIALKCLQKEPAKRYESATALADDLKRFVEGRPIEARRVSQTERTYRWCKRNPAVAGLLGTVAVLLVVGFAGATAAAIHFRRTAASERTARREASIALGEAIEARREAIKQSQAAEASFAHARKAVDESFTTVSESKLLNVPGLRALRAELLGSAITFYEQFIQEHRDDPSLLRELLQIRLRVAGVLRELGRITEATDAYKTIIVGCEQALVDQPGDTDFKAGLAEARQAGADASPEYQNPANFRRIVALREEVLKARPADVENKQRLALAWNDVGVFEANRTEALSAFARSMSLRLDLAEALPDDPVVIHGLGESFNNLAMSLRNWGDNGDLARTMIARAVEYYRESLRIRPNDYIAQELVHASSNLTTLLLEAGHQNEAIAELRKSLETLGEVARANPEAPRSQNAYVQMSRKFADLLAEQKKSDEAAGTLLGSRTALGKLSRETPADIAGAAGLKVDFARRLGEIKANLTPEQKAMRGELLDRALRDYREAVAGGWRDDGILKNATPLKDRPGYAALLAEAESAAKEPAAPPAPGGADVASAAIRPQPAAARSKLDVKLGRATLHSALGSAYARIGVTDEAFAMMDKAHALFDALVRERPGDSKIATGRIDALRSFLAALHRLALERLKAGKADESAAIRKKADALYADLSRERPNDPDVQALRWNDLLGLSGFYREAGRWPENYRALKEGEMIARQAAQGASKENPANRVAALALARIGFEYGKLAL